MSVTSHELVNLSLLIAAIAAAAVAGVSLAAEFLRHEVVRRYAPRACTLVLAVIGLVTLWRETSTIVVAGYASVATILLVVWSSLNWAAEHPCKKWLPRVTWAVVLGLSIVAARLLSMQAIAPPRQASTAPPFQIEDFPVADLEAVTDQGTRLPLFQSRFYGPDAEISNYLIQLEAEQGQVIRLYDADPICNCHGWIFTAGQFALRDVDVTTILKDNGYSEVEQVKTDDLVVYFDESHATHTGIVRLVEPSGVVVVESKWGAFGVYLHPAHRQPFAGSCRFFRSSRRRHELAILPMVLPTDEADHSAVRH